MLGGFGLACNNNTPNDTIGVHGDLSKVNLTATLTGKPATLNSQYELIVPPNQTGTVVATIKDPEHYQFAGGKPTETVITDHNMGSCSPHHASNSRHPGDTQNNSGNTSAVLASTGSHTGQELGLGFGLVGAGGLLLLATRRRRWFGTTHEH